MRKLLLFLCALPCFAASSDVIITGQNIGAQILRPVTISRVFKRGEISAFAQPIIGGVGVPSVWQNDVKTRYRDAHATFSVSGAAQNAMSPSTGVIRVTTSAPHGFQEGEIVTISGVLGNTAANGTFTIRNISSTAFDILNSTSNGAYTSGGSVTGPAPGSLKHVLISFPATIPAAPGSITVSFGRTDDQCSSGDPSDCATAGLDSTGMLAFNGGTWTGVVQTTASGVTYTTSVRDMITGGACTYWQLGPAATSVVCQGGMGGTYDFGYDCATLCTANYTISTSTGNGVSPIVLTTDLTNDLVTGEQVTVVDVAGNTAANGLWTLGTVTSNTAALVGSTGNGAYSANTDRITRMFNLSTWTGSASKGLHPIFVLTFPTGWAGVKIESILENVSTGVGRDQYYVLDISTSAGSVYNHAVTQYAWTRWHRSYWDGSEPGGAGKEYTGMKVDYSLAYLIESKIVLPYDQTMNPAVEQPGYNGISTWKSRYAQNTESATQGIRCYGPTTYCGDISYNMGTTGARGDIGPVASWDVAYVYTWDPDLGAVVRGNSDNTGLMPMHVRESVSGKAAYDQAGTVASLDRYVSMDSRKTLSLEATFSQYSYDGTGSSSGTSLGDRITPLITPLSRGHKWTLDASHFPSTIFVSYLTTGEWWHYSNLLYQAHSAVGWRRPGASVPKFKINGYPDTVQTRAWAWTFRDMLLGSEMATDGTPEQNYLQQKVNNTIAYNDGALNDTTSRFYDPAKTSPFAPLTETSIWGFGRGMLSGMANGSGSWPNPLGMSPGGVPECVDLVQLNTSVIPSIPYCGKPFMWSFVYHIFHLAKRFNRPVDTIRAAMAPWPIEAVQSPDACTFCTSNYNMPVRPGNLTSPTLTSTINASVLTVPISSFPASWQTVSTPFTVVIGSETLKICSIDVGALTMTVCSGTSNGRGFFGTTAASHTSGVAVESREYFTTWASQATGWLLPWTTTYAWISGISDSYALYLQAAQSSYVSATSNGYSGQTAYDILQTAFLENAYGQVSGANNDPKFKLAGDPTPPTIPPSIVNGGVVFSGKGKIQQ